MKTTRREFCGLAGAAVASGFGLPGVPGRRRLCAAGGGIERSDLRITRISRFSVESTRWKVVGKNSHLGSHGKAARDRVLHLETGTDLHGIGSCFAGKAEVAQLLGKDPLSFYRPGIGVVSPLGNGDAPLWDLVAKIHQQPAWRLFGGYGPEWVPCYDGSIYFSDLEPEYASRGIDRILEEVEHGLEEGHRAFKIKVGRGYKWMEKKAGLERDIEVVRAIRKEVGPDVKLMTDANNGYDLATTKRFLEEVNDELHFVEEMFPEDIEEDLELKTWLRQKGWRTLVADGESAREEKHFVPYIQARALDVLQGDMRRFGFTRLLNLSRMTSTTGIRLAPHNWGSYLGFYMQLVLARGIPNFLMAEQDPGKTDLFAGSSRFELREGKVRVPEVPGCGLEFRRDEFARRHSVDWVLR